MASGWESFCLTIKTQLKNSLDILVAAIHFVLVKKFDFKSITTGNDPKLNELERLKDSLLASASESLPNNWNSQENIYDLIYCFSTEFIQIKCFSIGENIIVQSSPLNSNSSSEINSLIILKSEYLSDIDSNNITKNFQQDKIDGLTKLLHEKIFYKYPLTLKPFEKIKTEHLNMSESNKFNIGKTDKEAKQNSVIDDTLFPNIGSSDLDPLGRSSGSGMLFDPFGNNRLRPSWGPQMPAPHGPRTPFDPLRGKFPPFRYDPLGPPPDQRFFTPDPDHLPPPGPDHNNFYM